MLNAFIFEQALSNFVSKIVSLKRDESLEKTRLIELLKLYIKVSLGLQEKTSLPSESALQFPILEKASYLSIDEPRTVLISHFHHQVSRLEQTDFDQVAVILNDQRHRFEQLDPNFTAFVDASLEQFKTDSSVSVTTLPEPSFRQSSIVAEATVAEAMEDVRVYRNEVSVTVDTPSWEIKQLKQLFEDLVAEHGGDIQVTNGEIQQTFRVTVTGDASFVYSVYSPFFNAGNHLQELTIDKQCVGTFTIILEGLRQKIKERNALKFVKDYLSLQGFNVEDGGKPAPRVFPEADAFKRQDQIAFKQCFGVSLSLANQLHKEVSSRVSMPFACAAETSDKALKDDLNFCFKELELVASNGQSKECIDLKTGHFLANIGSSQAVKLEKHFQQRAMLLGRADDAKKNSVKVAGGPVRAVERIRANLILSIESELRGSKDAPRQLRKLCLGHPADLIGRYNACDQQEFVTRLETAMNKHFIIGPSSFNFFLSPDLLSMVTGAAEASSAPEPIETLGKLLSSQALDDASNPVAKDSGILPHKKEYLDRYPRTDANNNIAFHLRALDPRSSEHERESIVKASGVLRDRLEQIREFKTQHSPFYLVQHITDKLRFMLQGANEDKITEMLTVLGLNEEGMSIYRIVGPNLSRYNVYHIEFMLPLWVLSFCMDNAIVLRPQFDLQADLQKYLYNPFNKTTAKDNEAAWTALEWSYNEQFDCRWVAGESRGHNYNSGYGRFFGGSTDTGMGTGSTVRGTDETTLYKST